MRKIILSTIILAILLSGCSYDDRVINLTKLNASHAECEKVFKLDFPEYDNNNFECYGSQESIDYDECNCCIYKFDREEREHSTIKSNEKKETINFLLNSGYWIINEDNEFEYVYD